MKNHSRDMEYLAERSAERAGKSTDRRSFILGMITAFSECVAGGCKRMALSPPMAPGDWGLCGAEACRIVERHGLLWYREMNMDMPEEGRFEWIVIAGRRETLDRYRELRREGLSPARSLEPFHELLSYDEEQAVRTGYDAFRSYFPEEKA